MKVISLGFFMTNRSVVASVMLIVVALSLVACSQDRHVFRSTVFSPKTIAVRDMVSHRVIWSKDVPVGYKLVMDFDSPYEMAPFRIGSNPPKTLTWKINRIEPGTLPHILDTLLKSKKGKLSLPGVNIIIDVTLRPVPEYPPGYSPDPPENEAKPTPLPVTEAPVSPVEDMPEPQPEVSSSSPIQADQDDQPASAADSQSTDTTRSRDSTEPVDPALEEVLDDLVDE